MNIEDLREELGASRKTFEYRLEKALFEVSEKVALLIDEKDIAKTELAKNMGVAPAYITKILRGNPNLTIKSLLKIADGLDSELVIDFTPKLGALASITTSAQPVDTVRRFVYVSNSVSAQPTVAEGLHALADAA